ncbi:hypothetical protein BS78_10G100600 [Paspalum vaginatum]|nr:hypothetical protein BS78_10G100600 [Paspalum vaginatum]
MSQVHVLKHLFSLKNDTASAHLQQRSSAIAHLPLLRTVVLIVIITTYDIFFRERFPPGFIESLIMLGLPTYNDAHKNSSIHQLVSLLTQDTSSKDHNHGWAFQLLSVACLSLAAKMEETSVPSLLDLQIESKSCIFEPRTVQRMELLVLAELDWRLRSLTPFAFIDLFACKADLSGRCARSLVLRACQITLNAIHETEFLNHCPASTAAAAVLSAAAEMPGMSCTSISPETAAAWCTGLTEEGIRSCYQLLQQLPPSTTTTRREILASELLRSTPSSVSWALPSKRRKINGCLGEE